MNPSEVIPHLPSWSEKDLLLIQALITKLLVNSENPPGPLYDTLCTASGSMLPFSTFRRRRYYKAWLANEEQIMLFMTKNWPDANKVLLNSLKHFLFKMLADDLKRRRIRVTVGTLALNAGSTPAIFEQSFPGYLSAGLAPVILMAMVTRNGKGAAHATVKSPGKPARAPDLRSRTGSHHQERG